MTKTALNHLRCGSHPGAGGSALLATLSGVLSFSLCVADAADATELLYNGVTLPLNTHERTDMSAYGNDPLPTPYLDKPPQLISVEIGRQLFVDDFLIENTDLTRTWHKAVKDQRNPVMHPETDLELGTHSGNAPMAAPFSGGIWYDGSDRLFKMWYCAGWFDGTAYAFSHNGISWERPELKVEPGTNRIVPRKGVRDSCAVILDPHAAADEMRFKMLLWSRPQGGELFVSQDGLEWSEPVSLAPTGDRSTIFYNPFRRKWVYSIRSGWSARSRAYSESSDFLGGADLINRVKWLRADNLDLPDPHWFYAFPERKPERGGDKPALYNFDAVAYESLMLGAFTIHLGPANNFCADEGVPKITEIHLGFSRDGFHWSRPIDRTPFIPAARAEGTWDRAYLHSNAALCLVMDDELWFYYTGFAGNPKRKKMPGNANGLYCNAATGIARLRRDGFASMDADARFGELTTRPMIFERGKFLFVNADTIRGKLLVEARDNNGKTIPGFEKSACHPFSGDSTHQLISWQSGKTMAELQNRPVRLRFHLQQGSLYSFWISDKNGASNGWLAGGSPGHKTLRDTW
jgi:hypothetical protein